MVILTNLTQLRLQQRQKTDTRMTSDDLFVVVVVILHKICHTCGMTHASATIHKQKHHCDILERRVLPLRWEKLQKKSYSGFFCQSTVTMVFTHWPREDSFPLSRALGGTCWHLNHFCNILLQDLTPLHVKITRSTNLLSVCRGGLKLSTYLHTVSYNHISFLNTHSQLLWVLTSSEFYSTTWRMISRSAGYKIHFRKQPPFRGNFFPLSVWYLSFFWISSPWQFVHGSRVFTQSNK